LNRTKVELKFRVDVGIAGMDHGLNRTKVELKSGVSGVVAVGP